MGRTQEKICIYGAKKEEENKFHANFLREIYENLCNVTPHLARVGGYAICTFFSLLFI